MVIDQNRPVRVFRNWKHDCYSIMQGGKLAASARQVRLADVEFRVREPARRRMLASQRRSVHAFAVGRLLDFVHPHDPRELGPLPGRSAVYDPWRFGSFVDRDSEAPVAFSRLVQLDEQGITYLDSESAPGRDAPHTPPQKAA